MKASPYTIPLLSVILLFTACREAALAQNVVFSAAANASKIGVADQLQVTYTIQDVENLQSLTPAFFKDFKVLGGPFQSQNTSMQVVGNRMTQSSSLSFTFILQAKHTGSVIIPPATAKDAAGHAYQSNALPIEIVPGSVVARPQQRRAMIDPFDDPFDPFKGGRGLPQQPTRPQQVAAPKVNIGKDIFIKVDVDKRNVHIGEQLTAYYKLYARIPMQVAISKLPSLNGFWTQDFDIPKQPKPVDEVVDGKHYQVFVLKKSALFPQQAGNLVLDAAEAEGTARVITQVQQRNPFDDPFFKQFFGNSSLMLNDPFFSDPFGDMAYENVPVHLKSSPVTITVTDLPANGKPADFTGAVGSFSLSSKLDKTSLTTDDVATLTLKVSGSGNLKLFDAPKPVLPNGLDIYDPNILDTITGRSTTISGDKIITYTIAPRKSGDYTLPPISLSWYDPKTGSYKNASTSSFKLHVSPGKGVLTAERNKGATGDIVDNMLLRASHPLILSPGYWAMYSVPMLAFIGIVFYRRRKDEEEAHADEYRTRKAGGVAQKRLSAAGVMLQKGNSRGFYDELSKAIWLYLSDKLGIPISSLGKATASQAMERRGVPETVRQQVTQILDECEMALYAPVGGSQQMQQSFSEAASVINSLERTLRT